MTQLSILNNHSYLIEKASKDYTQVSVIATTANIPEEVVILSQLQTAINDLQASINNLQTQYAAVSSVASTQQSSLQGLIGDVGNVSSEVSTITQTIVSKTNTSDVLSILTNFLKISSPIKLLTNGTSVTVGQQIVTTFQVDMTGELGTIGSNAVFYPLSFNDTSDQYTEVGSPIVSYSGNTIIIAFTGNTAIADNTIEVSLLCFFRGN